METKKTAQQELQDWINKPVLERIEEVHGCLPVYAVNLATPVLMIHQVTDFGEDGTSCTIRKSSPLSLVDYKNGMMNMPENEGEYGKTLTIKPGQKDLKKIIVPYHDEPIKVLEIKLLKEKFVLLIFQDDGLVEYND